MHDWTPIPPEAFDEKIQFRATDPLNEEAFRMLHAMIQHIHKSKDPTPLIENLRDAFSTADSLLIADQYLWQVYGMSYIDACLFSRLYELTRYVERTSYGEKPKLNRLMVASPYLAANFFAMQEEHFYLFCINHHGRLKRRSLISKGTEYGALMDIKKLVVENIRCKPAACFVAHNHPGGTLRPSQEDIDCTRSMMAPLALMGVPLLDHLIVTDHNVVSIRLNGFIPEREWMAQSDHSPLLRKWLMSDEEAEKSSRRRRKPAAGKKGKQT